MDQPPSSWNHLLQSSATLFAVITVKSMSSTLENSHLHHFVILQFIITPSLACLVLVPSFQAPKVLTFTICLFCSLTFVLLLVVVHLLQCWTTFFAKASLPVQKALNYDLQALASFSAFYIYLVECIQSSLQHLFCHPTFLSFLPAQAALIYAIFPCVFLFCWYPLEAIIQQL